MTWPPTVLLLPRERRSRPRAPASRGWPSTWRLPVAGRCQLAETLALLPPGLLELKGGGRFLVLLPAGRRIALVAPDGGRKKVRLAEIAAAATEGLDGSAAPAIDALLQRVRIARSEKARRTMLDDRLADEVAARSWHLRLSPGSPPWSLARAARLPRLGALLAAVYVPKIGALLLLWWVLWEGGLRSPEPGWMIAIVLLVLTNLPFRLLEPWYGGLFAVRTGWLLKRRLLQGALGLDPEVVQSEGTGHQLGRTLEAENAERLALDGGILVGSHAIDVLLMLPLLGAGAGGLPHVLLLVVWLGSGVVQAVRIHRLRRRWVAARIRATHEMVEKMAGHSTRLIQERPRDRHLGEDETLEEYLTLSRRLDVNETWLAGLLPRGWVVLSLVVLAGGILGGTPTAGELGLGLGATLFAHQSLQALAVGFLSIAGAAVAGETILPLFRAAARKPLAGRPDHEEVGSGPVVDGRSISFSYPGSHRPALQDCDLRIEAGDHVLLQGPSGGGKSTLANLLLGLRRPSSGTLLLRGLDLPSRGRAAWRRRIAVAPQFHENRVLLGTFAFNLLLGRAWPPGPGDLEEAVEICRELDLGPLLDRMPAGLQQMMGEIGWQLSHGERSRLYIARALLGRGELVVLDESFGALDPDTMRRAMECVQRRSPTLLVVAHP